MHNKTKIKQKSKKMLISVGIFFLQKYSNTNGLKHTFDKDNAGLGYSD